MSRRRVGSRPAIAPRRGAARELPKPTRPLWRSCSRCRPCRVCRGDDDREPLAAMVSVEHLLVLRWIDCHRTGHNARRIGRRRRSGIDAGVPARPFRDPAARRLRSERRGCESRLAAGNGQFIRGRKIERRLAAVESLLADARRCRYECNLRRLRTPAVHFNHGRWLERAHLVDLGAGGARSARQADAGR